MVTILRNHFAGIILLDVAAAAAAAAAVAMGPDTAGLEDVRNARAVEVGAVVVFAVVGMVVEMAEVGAPALTDFAGTGTKSTSSLMKWIGVSESPTRQQHSHTPHSHTPHEKYTHQTPKLTVQVEATRSPTPHPSLSLHGPRPVFVWLVMLLFHSHVPWRARQWTGRMAKSFFVLQRLHQGRPEVEGGKAIESSKKQNIKGQASPFSTHNTHTHTHTTHTQHI